MRKRLVVLALAASLAATVPASAQMFDVSVGGESVTFTNQPIAVGANILVPLREALTQVGAIDIRFMAATNQVSFTHGGRQVVMDFISQTISVNGTTMAFAGPIRNLDSRFYVPASVITNLDPRFVVNRIRVLGFRQGQAPIPAAAPVNTFTFGGQSFTYQSPTWYMGDMLMIPLGETMGAMGVDIPAYTEGDLQAAFTFNGQNILLNILSGYAYVDEQARVLSRPVVTRGGIVYVPASFIAQLASGFSITGMRR